MKSRLLVAVAAIAVSAPVAAYGRDAAQGTDSASEAQGGVEDIVVTANRREQNLQSVGISIAALSGEQMRDLNITTALDVANATPNIEIIRSYASPGFNTQITIRGVGQPDFQDTTEATATAYVDEFYMIGAGQADFLSFDIARVEVARGPQGTVQGRNSTAGTLNYYTNRPNLTETSGRAAVTIAEHGTIRTDGFLNVPVSSSLALRAAFSTDTGDGYFRNVNPNASWQRGGQSRFYAGRIQALYSPNSDFSLLLKGEYGKMGPVTATNERMYPVGQIAGRPGTYAIPADAFGQTPASIGAPGLDETNSDGASEIASEMRHFLATMKVRATDTLDFTVVGGYLRSNKYSIEDCDHTPLPLCNFSNKARSRHWMVEARGSYDNGPFRLTFGTSYLNHRIHTTSASPLFFGPTVTPFGTTLYGQAFDDQQDLKSFAVFGQAEYDLTDRLTVIGGLRYTHDNKVINAVNALTINLPLNTPLPKSIEAFEALRLQIFADPTASFTVLNRATNGDLAQFKKGLVNANIQLNFKASDDVLLYAGYRRGVKSGGFISGNVAGTPAALRPFGEEVNNAYEVGFKSTLADRALRINGALFYYDYQDMQNTSLIGITNVITNNDAKVYGGEIEITATPVTGLDLSLSGGYVHTRVQDINNPTGAVPIVSDNVLPLAPKWSGSARIRYSWDAFGGEMFTQAAARGRSSMYRDSLNNPSTRMPSLVVADVLVGYKAPDERWSISAFVNNVFNTRRAINLFDISGVGNSGEAVYQMPRWAGATLAVNF
ncbi:MAG: TonB-dependent receptor [Sphingomonadales bacterium]|nr:TonB-dependent receptor [Sphingomonadales bacterium]